MACVGEKDRDMPTIDMGSWQQSLSFDFGIHSVGKNKKLSKRGGTKKRAVDAFARKDWYQLKAPTFFSQRDLGRTPVNRSQGLSEYRYGDLGISRKEEKNGSSGINWRKLGRIAKEYLKRLYYWG